VSAGRDVVAGPMRHGVPLAAVAERARDWAVANGRTFLPFAIVAATAFVLRVVALANKPLHHDESEHAWFAWRIVTGEGYQYDPVFHGPLQFMLTTLVYVALDVGDFTARVAPALLGTAVTLLPFALRRQLGTTAALVSSVILCVSPSYLYFSRFAREDIYVAFVTLALVIAVFRFLAHPRPWQPSLILGLLAVAFATKETTYITAFVGGLFFIGAVGVEALRARGSRRSAVETPILSAVTAVGWEAWVWGVATFATVYTVLFTSFFTNPGGLRDGLVESISYWLSQQPVNRGSQPWFYYLVVLPAYEWAVILLGAIGIVAVFRRATLFGCFLVWMFAASLVVYSWASERMPWLVLHPLLPLVLLAGLGGQVLWRTRGRLVTKLAFAVVAVGAVYAVTVGSTLAFRNAADPRELLVFTQTSDDVPAMRDEIITLSRRAPAALGRPLTIEVDSWGGTGWPWGWYLRDVPAGYPDMSQAGFVPSADVVLVAEPNDWLMRPHLRAYTAHRFRLRVWWVPDWGAAGPTDWARWLLRRDTWSPTATMDETLYVRREVARLLSRSK
jgi:uncharacterized protein (TIGR03663 family)